MFDTSSLTEEQKQKIKNTAYDVAPYVAVGLLSFWLGRKSVKIPNIFPERLDHIGDGYFAVTMNNGARWVTDASVVDVS